MYEAKRRTVAEGDSKSQKTRSNEIEPGRIMEVASTQNKFYHI